MEAAMNEVAQRRIPTTGVLQEWVAKLGLRHQGVLLTAIRGCDTAPREDDSKAFTRALRGVLLNTHCADPKDAVSFIEACPADELIGRANALRKNLDHYPHHFVMHVVHACEVIGYCHPDEVVRGAFQGIYGLFCRSLHVRPETAEAMNDRLNANERAFGNEQQKTHGG